MFSKVATTCETRWEALGVGAEELDTRAPELAVGMPVVLTFFKGLDEHRISSAVSLWSKEGFRHNGIIKHSPKIGRVVF